MFLRYFFLEEALLLELVELFDEVLVLGVVLVRLDAASVIKLLERSRNHLVNVRVPLAQSQLVAIVVLQRLQDPRLSGDHVVVLEVVEQHLRLP